MKHHSSFIHGPVFTAPQHELWCQVLHELIGLLPKSSPWPNSAATFHE